MPNGIHPAGRVSILPVVLDVSIIWTSYFEQFACAAAFVGPNPEGALPVPHATMNATPAAKPANNNTTDLPALLIEFSSFCPPPQGAYQTAERVVGHVGKFNGSGEFSCVNERAIQLLSGPVDERVPFVDRAKAHVLIGKKALRRQSEVATDRG
jgi:hypothetical protein